MAPPVDLVEIYSTVSVTLRCEMVIVLATFFSLLGTGNPNEPPPAVCTFSYSDGIATVKTRLDRDLWTCLGFAHGRDRELQLEYYRRTVTGRMSELLGISKLKTDLFFRLLDLPHFARALEAKLDESMLERFQSYTRGVNAAFRNAPHSPELKSFNRVPEPWSVADTLSIIFLQSFNQTRLGLEQDFMEEEWLKRYPTATIALFSDLGLPWSTTVLNDRGPESILPSPHANPRMNKPAIPDSAVGQSNAWVISKARSGGSAWLVNDPHLELRRPPAWYTVRLKSSKKMLIGGTIPGIPALITGTNGSLAWGLTNSNYDTMDAMEPGESPRTSIRPWVWVRWFGLSLPYFFTRFERTADHRPLLPIPNEKPVELLWSGFSITPQDLEGILSLSDLETVKEADEKLSAADGIPSWTLVYADRTGAIGSILTGRHFDRRGLFLGVSPNRTPALLPAARRPRVLNPDSGYIVAANNRHSVALDGGRAYDSGFRAFRISERIQRVQRPSPDAYKEILCDTQIVDARFFLPDLLSHFPKEIERMVKPWREWLTDPERELPNSALYDRWTELVRRELGLTDAALYRELKARSEPLLSSLPKLFAQAELDLRPFDRPMIRIARFPHLLDLAPFAPDLYLPVKGNRHSPNTTQAVFNPERKRYEQTLGGSLRLMVELSNQPRVWIGTSGPARSRDPFDYKKWAACELVSVPFEVSTEPVKTVSSQTIRID